MAESDKIRRIDSVVWRTPAGGVVSCVEKLKVMSQNFRDMEQTAQDVLEDAILMGCDEDQVRAELTRLIQSLENPYRKP